MLCVLPRERKTGFETVVTCDEDCYHSMVKLSSQYANKIAIDRAFHRLTLTAGSCSMHPMEIAALNRFPEYAPILAHWSYMEWYRARSMDFNLVLRAYQERARNEGVPLSFVAMDGSLPVGMVTLKLDDLWSRKDLNPWLASLYVLPDYRKAGAGDALIRAVIARAQGLGYGRIYLFLGQHDRDWLLGYYLRRGWEVVEDAVDNDGLPTTILAYETHGF